MATFAMICNNRVIEVLYDQKVAPVWPPDPVGNLVTSVECSDEATRDWAYNPETGEVFEPVYVEPEPEAAIMPEPTQLDRIESMIAKSQEEIAQEARDAYTLELIEGGVIA